MTGMVVGGAKIEVGGSVGGGIIRLSAKGKVDSTNSTCRETYMRPVLM